ncbi:MAG TPA: 6-carboxytetrahydropterin synthase QueD [Acidimicrobiales bacterium]|nr:6-carboxytetrahydropterin synthase QueD [Acidimicrobiales bacterium]
MRTRVTKSFGFEAAHKLDWHQGACRNLHGHSYRLEVSVEGDLDGNGIVVDFSDLSAIVRREVIDRFDHTYLNDALENPTAELIAHEIWARLDAAGLNLIRLRLWETADSSVEIAR